MEVVIVRGEHSTVTLSYWILFWTVLSSVRVHHCRDPKVGLGRVWTMFYENIAFISEPANVVKWNFCGKLLVFKFCECSPTAGFTCLGLNLAVLELCILSLTISELIGRRRRVWSYNFTCALKEMMFLWNRITVYGMSLFPINHHQPSMRIDVYLHTQSSFNSLSQHWVTVETVWPEVCHLAAGLKKTWSGSKQDRTVHVEMHCVSIENNRC